MESDRFRKSPGQTQMECDAGVTDPVAQPIPDTALALHLAERLVRAEYPTAPR